jgi:hypothetical protein
MFMAAGNSASKILKRGSRMDITVQKKEAKRFSAEWLGRGDERQDTQIFWTELISKVYGVESPASYIQFEKPVTKGYIDVYIPETKVLIEQKSLGINLDTKEPRSDRMVTPYEQARDYYKTLGSDEIPRYIITCNFNEFRVYDTRIQPKYNSKTDTWYSDYELIELKDIDKEFYRLQFLVDVKDNVLKHEMDLSVAAGNLVGTIYNALLCQYQKPEDPDTLRSLNMLCVRLVFCLYAEDAGIFGRHSMFHDYLSERKTDARDALIKLFRYLDTPDEVRKSDPQWVYEKDDLKSFPYVNGGMFADENIIIPQIPPETVELILREASENFDWADISCTIFGGVFESTLNPETRRAGGMHYTSIENIHKVIDPLFLDALKEEFEEIKQIPVVRTKKDRLDKFHNKIASLKFLDPACGSGNFLTESFLSLRKLENEVIRQKLDLKKESIDGQIVLGFEEITPIKVSIQQFYGIEINDFAVAVAKTALWIAEVQMIEKTQEIVLTHIDPLPLKKYSNIHEGNALRMDWNDVIPKEQLNYIMGNPPFIGARLMTESQKEDLITIFGNEPGIHEIDYVSGWYKKAFLYIHEAFIQCAFVSTNSIVQGEQVPIIWEKMFSEGLKINFAYHTFIWNSEASKKANVHCVIIGFGILPVITKRIYHPDGSLETPANINAYLIDAPNVFIKNSSAPICNVQEMQFGSMPNDGNGLLSNYSEEQVKEVTSRWPEARKMFREFKGATEFLNSKKRYCLWLKDVPPEEIRGVPFITGKIAQVRENRQSSKREATRKLADTPYLFGEIRQPDTAYLLVPRHSSGNRRYIPIGYENENVICGDSNMLIPNATLYEFGVIESNIHMAWVRVVCGRIKSDYRYSASVVYNNFPWPSPTKEQKEKIVQTAQEILYARQAYPHASLADLYDPDEMPPILQKAHEKNDKAVMEAYGFTRDTAAYHSEMACVAELMKMYQRLTAWQSK